MFIKLVEEQLEKMTELDKDNWILEQAKVLSVGKQQGFIMSLSGKKKVQYMPSYEEIEEFCHKVSTEEIYVEYETHYYEFLEGCYYGDWDMWYNDPLGAFSFLNSVLRGCHDLVVLEEYCEAFTILEKICDLKFAIVAAEESEDGAVEEFYSIGQAVREGKLNRSGTEIAKDWIKSYIMVQNHSESTTSVKKLVDILEYHICHECKVSSLDDILTIENLKTMISLLKSDIPKMEKERQKIDSNSISLYEEYSYRNKVDRKKRILLEIQEML